MNLALEIPFFFMNYGRIRYAKLLFFFDKKFSAFYVFVAIIFDVFSEFYSQIKRI